MTDRLDTVLSFYKPNVGRGNFMPDVYARGRNDALISVAVALDLATEEEIRDRMRERDDEAWRRSEAAIARVTARAAAERRALDEDHDG